MRSLGASRRVVVAATTVFVLGQFWAAYVLSEHLVPLNGAEGGTARWLLFGAVFVMAAGEIWTVFTGTKAQ